jgi:hypothetical protein
MPDDIEDIEEPSPLSRSDATLVDGRTDSPAFPRLLL